MNKILFDLRGLFSFPATPNIKPTGIARATIEWASRLTGDPRLELVAPGLAVSSRNLLSNAPQLSGLAAGVPQPASLPEKLADLMNCVLPAPATRQDLVSKMRRWLAIQSLNVISGPATTALLRQRTQGADKSIFFVPFVRDLPAALPPSCIPVMNVFDIIPLVFRDSMFGDSGSQRDAIVKTAELGGRFIVNSKHTRLDLISMFAIPPERVFVLPLGVDESNTTPSHKPAKEPYFLYVCSDVQRRKNIPFTIRAFSRFLENTNAPHRLIIVGGGTDRLDAMISANAGKWQARVKGAGRVSDEEISAIYSSADAGLFLSLYEGFGLPVLEYMRYGVPVISSNVTSLPEVAGDAAVLVDPFSEEGAAEAMARISGNRTLRDELVAKGRARVDEFSWDRSAKGLAAIFDSVLA